MERPSMCRICLAVDVRMHAIVAGHLQEMYENLSMTPLETQDNRPTLACYICFAMLKNCYRLRQNCIQSEKLLTQMLSDRTINDTNLRGRSSFKQKLRVAHPVMQMSLQDEVEQHTDCNVERAANKVYFQVKIEPIDSEERDPLEDDTVSESEEPFPIAEAVYNVPHEIKVEEEPSPTNYYFKQETEQSQPFDVEDDMPLQEFKRDLSSDTHTSRSGPEKIRLPTTGLKSEDASLKIITPTPSTSNSASDIFFVNHIRFSLNENCKQNFVSEGSTQNVPNEGSCLQNHFTNVLNKTNLTHAFERPYQCDVCNHCFKRKDNLECHVRIHADTKLYQCTVCDKSFNRKYGFENHIRIHTGEKPYQCNICKKCYRVKSSLDSHVSTHTGEKPYKCDTCQKCFNHKSVLDNHVLLHTGEKPHHCSYCDKRFNHRGNLNSHLRVHTGEKPNQCNMCKKCYKLKSNLDNHVCPQTCKKPYQCDICKKSFAMKVNLNNHIRTHTGEKPFQCDVCNKCFSQKGILDNHTRTHTGEKPYKCDVCLKCFKRKSHLESHSRIHSGSKPYQCDVCKKCFSRKNILKSHKLQHSANPTVSEKIG